MAVLKNYSFAKPIGVGRYLLLLGVSQKKISPDTYWFSKTVNFDAAIPWTLVSDLGFEENFAGI